VTLYKDEWIKLQDIEDVYDNISKGSLSTTARKERRDGRDTTKWYRPCDGKFVEVNMGYLKYVWERRRRIQFQCQDLYYKHREKYSEAKIARMFGKYVDITTENATVFLTNVLFANTYYTNLSKTHISRKLIQFNNFCNELRDELVFRSIDDEFDYYEALKMKNEVIK